MKRVIMICCLVASSGLLKAQSGQGMATLSKADFGEKVKQLNVAMEKNKTDDAQALWKDVHTMMMTELAITKFKIKDAVDTKNDADKDKYLKTLADQRSAYSQALKASEHMADNKAVLSKELDEFQALIL